MPAIVVRITIKKIVIALLNQGSDINVQKSQTKKYKWNLSGDKSRGQKLFCSMTYVQGSTHFLQLFFIWKPSFISDLLGMTSKQIPDEKLLNFLTNLLASFAFSQDESSVHFINLIMSLSHKNHRLLTSELKMAFNKELVSVIDEFMPRTFAQDCAMLHGIEPLHFLLPNFFPLLVKKLPMFLSLEFDTKIPFSQQPAIVLLAACSSLLTKYAVDFMHPIELDQFVVPLVQVFSIIVKDFSTSRNYNFSLQLASSLLKSFQHVFMVL